MNGGSGVRHDEYEYTQAHTQMHAQPLPQQVKVTGFVFLHSMAFFVTHHCVDKSLSGRSTGKNGNYCVPRKKTTTCEE